MARPRIPSNITVNGIAIDTCRKIIINGQEANKVTVNGVIVYELACPPTTPISYDLVPGPACEQYTHNFNVSNGIPTPQHDLYKNNILHVSDITPGYIEACSGNSQNTYYVKAHNTAGFIDSNSDTEYCSSCCVPEYIVFDIPGTHTFTVPSYINSINLCMIGGGGGGSYRPLSLGYCGGGYSGIPISQTISVTPNENITIVVGSGGAAAPGDQIKQPGEAGTNSSFDSILSNGGAGGNPDGGYSGDGNSRIGCWGTSYDGGQAGPAYGFGGQAGFGNGGNGGECDTSATNGGVGAGGGAHNDNNAGGGCMGNAGAGGRGEVKIETICSNERTEAKYLSKMSKAELLKYNIKLNIDEEWIETYNIFKKNQSTMKIFPSTPIIIKGFKNV